MNFPSGVPTSITFPTANFSLANLEKNPFWMALTAIRNSPLFGEEQIEYALLISCPSRVIFKFTYCPATNW